MLVRASTRLHADGREGVPTAAPPQPSRMSTPTRGEEPVPLLTRLVPRLVVPALALFMLLAVLVAQGWSALARFDTTVSDRLHTYALAHHAFVTSLTLVADSGSTLAWIVILTPVTVILWVRGRHREAWFVAVTAVASSWLNSLVKAVVARPRPSFDVPVAVANGHAFPSGHCQAAVVGYGVLLVVLLPTLRTGARRWATAFALVMVLAIGFARIGLGVHYPSDVLGGYLLGVAVLGASVWAFRLDRPPAGRGSAWPRPAGSARPRDP